MAVSLTSKLMHETLNSCCRATVRQKRRQSVTQCQSHRCLGSHRHLQSNSHKRRRRPPPPWWATVYSMHAYLHIDFFSYATKYFPFISSYIMMWHSRALIQLFPHPRRCSLCAFIPHVPPRASSPSSHTCLHVPLHLHPTRASTCLFTFIPLGVWKESEDRCGSLECSLWMPVGVYLQSYSHVLCPKGHKLACCRPAFQTEWACAIAIEGGVCMRGMTVEAEYKTVPRYGCGQCDYLMCDKCYKQRKPAGNPEVTCSLMIDMPCIHTYIHMSWQMVTYMNECIYVHAMLVLLWKCDNLYIHIYLHVCINI